MPRRNGSICLDILNRPSHKYVKGMIRLFINILKHYMGFMEIVSICAICQYIRSCFTIKCLWSGQKPR